MSFTTYKNNAYNFSEATDASGLGDMQVAVTNGQGRAALPFEILLQAVAPFYCGEVRDPDGIANGASGRINIEHRRTIRTAQIDPADTFVVDAEVYFQPGGAGAAGKIVDLASKAAGSIKYGRVVAFGGVATAHTWLEIRPYAYDPARALEV